MADRYHHPVRSGLSRRTAVQAGALGMFGLSLDGVAAARAAAAPTAGRQTLPGPRHYREQHLKSKTIELTLVILTPHLWLIKLHLCYRLRQAQFFSASGLRISASTSPLSFGLSHSLGDRLSASLQPFFRYLCTVYQAVINFTPAVCATLT